MHAMTIEYSNQTMCGIELFPLRFISQITHHKLYMVDDPCDKCLKKIEELMEEFEENE